MIDMCIVEHRQVNQETCPAIYILYDMINKCIVAHRQEHAALYAALFQYIYYIISSNIYII